MANSIVPRHNSLGRALWGMHALWAAALAKWQEANDDTTDWDGIEFDKLAHSIHLIWKAHHDAHLVSFDSVYESQDGVHGPGPALSNKEPRGTHIFALDAISRIQKSLGNNPDVHLLSLHEKKWRGKTNYEVKPGREKTWLPLHLSATLETALRGDDGRYFILIKDLFSTMTREEVRALGTHQSKQGTLRSIEYNVYVHFFRRLLREVSALRTPDGTTEIAVESDPGELTSLRTALNEIQRKTVTNRESYLTARAKVERAACDPQNTSAKLALTIFEPAESIWDSHEVQRWAGECKKLNDLLDYMNALHVIIRDLPVTDFGESKQKHENRVRAARDRGTNAIQALRIAAGINLPALPRTCQDAFAWDDLRDSIAAMFSGLPGETLYRMRYDEMVQRDKVA